MKELAIWLALAAASALPALADESAASAEHKKVVTSVQAQLGVPPSGRMDGKTKAAVKRFQRAKGLKPTGELDKQTLTALGMGGPQPEQRRADPSIGEKPSTPVGPEQSSAERTAEPTIKPERPTGEAKPSRR